MAAAVFYTVLEALLHNSSPTIPELHLNFNNILVGSTFRAVKKQAQRNKGTEAQRKEIRDIELYMF